MTLLKDELVPMLELPTLWKDMKEDLANKIVDAMKTCGFLLVKSPPTLLSYEFQQDVLNATKQFLTLQQNDNNNNRVVQHPQDPKVYAMLSPPFSSIPSIFTEYHNQMEQLKTILLHLLDIGLQNKQQQQQQKSLVSLHSQKNNTLRLLYYPPTTNHDGGGGNRCKEHSDYGTITLLLIDGVSGLEFYHDETNSWIPVPYIPGSIIVNIGTWLSETYNRDNQHILKATLHRVAGPKSFNSRTPLDVLQKASQQGRTSIAFFADPNANEPIHENTSNHEQQQQQQQTIAEYIQWRSGGGSDSKNRTGVAYTINEQNRIQSSSSSSKKEHDQSKP